MSQTRTGLNTIYQYGLGLFKSASARAGYWLNQYNQPVSLGERYRLLPSQMDALIETMACKEENEGADVTKYQMEISSQSSYKQNERYYLIKKNINTSLETIALFNTGKDSQLRDNEPQLIFVADLMQRFREIHPELIDCTLLLPMNQCEVYFKLAESPPIKQLKKRHIVLVEVDLLSSRICVHDSQPGFLSGIYQDNLKSQIPGFDYQYHAYGTQQFNNIECGYYVHEMMRRFLKDGHSGCFNQINLNIIHTHPPDKTTYLKEYMVKPEAKKDEIVPFTMEEFEKEVEKPGFVRKVG